jgi:hypothetical protein
MFGTAKRIQNQPADLLELYRGVTNDDDHTTQCGKIRNIVTTNSCAGKLVYRMLLLTHVQRSSITLLLLTHVQGN